MAFRTDDHNNPTAFTTDVAHIAHLVEGVDYAQGEPFQAGTRTLYTAKLLGDPLELTIRVITAIGFFTEGGAGRWSYVGIPYSLWLQLSREQKIDVIGWMYHHEGGVSMVGLFPNYQSFR